MFPTPRRALFTTATMMDSFGNRGKHVVGQDHMRRAMELMIEAEYVTTPPLPPSSSPCHVEMMDVSPLPHKAPFAAQLEVPSPSPAPSSVDQMALESPVPAPRQASLEPAKPILPE